MAPIATARSNDGPTYVASVMPSKAPTYVIGIDVGGTNTDRYEEEENPPLFL